MPKTNWSKMKSSNSMFMIQLFCTANNCSESAVEWLQFHFSYSDPLHAVSHCTPLQWINVTIAVEATCHDLGWKDFENCVLKMLKVFLKWCKKHRQKTAKITFFTHQKLGSFPRNQFTMQEMQKLHLILHFLWKYELVIITLKNLLSLQLIKYKSYIWLFYISKIVSL